MGRASKTQIERGVEKIFESVMGYPVSVTYELLDHITRGPNGKFRSTVREFRGEELRIHLLTARSTS